MPGEMGRQSDLMFFSKRQNGRFWGVFGETGWFGLVETRRGLNAI